MLGKTIREMQIGPATRESVRAGRAVGLWLDRGSVSGLVGSGLTHGVACNHSRCKSSRRRGGGMPGWGAGGVAEALEIGAGGGLPLPEAEAGRRLMVPTGAMVATPGGETHGTCKSYDKLWL